MSRVTVKCETWPLVLKNDDGIRPAGRSDQCFYCNQFVGNPHGEECVCVSSLVRYEVYMNLERPARQHDKGRKVGTFTRHDPHFWTFIDCEFHKNDSSWCADNAEDAIVWDNPEDKEHLQKYIESTGIESIDADGFVNYNPCLCTPLYFEYDETVDEGPFVEIRKEEEVK